MKNPENARRLAGVKGRRQRADTFGKNHFFHHIPAGLDESSRITGLTKLGVKITEKELGSRMDVVGQKTVRKQIVDLVSRTSVVSPK